MKAMVLTAPHELGVDEVERPKPGHNEVLVRVSNSGICGTDLKIYKGAIPLRHPLIMGHEMIGVTVVGGDEKLRRGPRHIIYPHTLSLKSVTFNSRVNSLATLITRLV